MNPDKTKRMEHFISLLDDYIDGNLGDAQKLEIETALREDPFLNEVLHQHVQARTNMRIAGEEELRKKFADSFEPIPEPPKPKSNLWKILIAILLLAGLAIGAYLYLNQEKQVEQERPLMASVVDDKLLLSNVEDPSYDLLRSESDSASVSLWQEVVQSFIDKDYYSTISKISEIEADSAFHNKHIGKVSLMKGVSQLKLEQYKEAENALSKISNENPYFDQAEWYLALGYFYAKDKTKAQDKLELIANDKTHYKNKQAQQYLDMLSQQ